MTISVNYEELDGSPVESIDDRGRVSVQRILQCDWSDRWTLMREVLADGGLPLEDYTPPTVPPGFTSLPVRAKTCGCLPSGQNQGTGTVNAYPKARVAVRYRMLTMHDEDPDELVAESLEPTGEMQVLDYTKFRWGAPDGDRLEEDEAPAKLVRSLDYAVKMFRVTTILPAVLTLIGKVNEDPVLATLLGVTFPAQTLLYNPPVLERSITTEGVGAWDLGFRFSFRPDGWNAYWRAATQAYSTIYLAGGAEYLSYPLGDFGAL